MPAGNILKIARETVADTPGRPMYDILQGIVGEISRGTSGEKLPEIRKGLKEMPA